ncbi:hypothetical protein KIW84_052067 [Lathyrus oleraceus]|uniref:Uncharacterized protein n=1 Tax=Pisum sativum TaxID=3888 RepID=A0A9D5AEM5_PEA|nr:hypothetical protein KIW84_052067 [Pisum sativum]
MENYKEGPKLAYAYVIFRKREKKSLSTTSLNNFFKMVGTQNKHILVIFFLLCFFSIHIQVRARVLKERSNQSSEDASKSQKHKEVHADLFKLKEEEGNVDSEVFAMDYTPASRKPPIHN